MNDQQNIGNLNGGESVTHFLDETSHYHTIGAEVDSSNVDDITRTNFFVGMMYEFKILVTAKIELDGGDVTTPTSC